MIDFDKTLFNISIKSAQPSTGCLLVAEPFLADNYFNHAVVLLVDYAPRKSAMGIVMNRLTQYTLGALIRDFDDEVDIPIYCGGPMSPDRLFYIHRMGAMFAGAQAICDDLYIGGDYEQVCEYIREGLPTEGLIRFFIGYSGWDAGQLEHEISQSVWAVTSPMSSKRMLMSSDDAYWHRVVRHMGPAYAHWLLHPMYPQSN